MERRGGRFHLNLQLSSQSFISLIRFLRACSALSDAAQRAPLSIHHDGGSAKFCLICRGTSTCCGGYALVTHECGAPTSGPGRREGCTRSSPSAVEIDAQRQPRCSGTMRSIGDLPSATGQVHRCRTNLIAALARCFAPPPRRQLHKPSSCAEAPSSGPSCAWWRAPTQGPVSRATTREVRPLPRGWQCPPALCPHTLHQLLAALALTPVLFSRCAFSMGLRGLGHYSVTFMFSMGKAEPRCRVLATTTVGQPHARIPPIELRSVWRDALCQMSS